MNDEAKKIVATLGLAPLPHEGGWFRQQYVSEARLPDGRAMESLIWFLLTADDFSALHEEPRRAIDVRVVVALRRRGAKQAKFHDRVS